MCLFSASLRPIFKDDSFYRISLDLRFFHLFWGKMSGFLNFRHLLHFKIGVDIFPWNDYHLGCHQKVFKVGSIADLAHVVCQLKRQRKKWPYNDNQFLDPFKRDQYQDEENWRKHIKGVEWVANVLMGVGNLHWLGLMEERTLYEPPSRWLALIGFWRLWDAISALTDEECLLGCSERREGAWGKGVAFDRKVRDR